MIKIKNKKFFYSFISILIILIFISSIYFYNKTYSCIVNDKKQLENILTTFINRGYKSIDEVNIKQSMSIGNKMYILFLNENDDFGNATLVKGLNGKYKIEEVRTGTKLVDSTIDTINKLKYLIIFGENSGMKVDFIQTRVNEILYSIQIPEEEYFISYCPIEKNTNQKHPDYNQIEIHYIDNTTKIY